MNGLKYPLHTCGKGWLAIAFSFKSNIKTIIVNFATIFHRILTIKIGVLVEIKGVIIFPRHFNPYGITKWLIQVDTLDLRDEDSQNFIMCLFVYDRPYISREIQIIIHIRRTM